MNDSIKEKLVKRIVEQLENNEIPWKRPWKRGRVCRNYNSKREYSGINRLILPDGEFMTFYQAKKEGFKIKKGASGYTISVPKEVKRKKVVEEENEKGEKEEVLKTYKYFSFTLATVFHIDDIEGAVSKIKEEDIEEWDPLEKVEEEIARGVETLNVKVSIERRDRAYYIPDFHQVNIPEKKQFEKPEDFYRVYLHELGHATGHESLLARDLTSGSMQTQSYAKEELVAEIFSYGLLGEYGLTTQKTEEQQISYIKGWLERIKEDPDTIIKAATQADKAMQLFSVKN